MSSHQSQQCKSRVSFDRTVLGSSTLTNKGATPIPTDPRRHIPWEVIYYVIRLTPRSDLRYFLPVSRQIRREAQTWRYREIRLSNPSQIISFALIVTIAGEHVHSLDIVQALPTDNGVLRTILDQLPQLKVLTVGRESQYYPRLDIDFLPTLPCFDLHSLSVDGPIEAQDLTPFLETQRESLLHLSLSSHTRFWGATVQFRRLLSVHTNSNAIWDIIRQGTVVCIFGNVGSPPDRETFPTIRAVQDFVMQSPTLLTLPTLFPELRFLQAAVHVSCITLARLSNS